MNFDLFKNITALVVAIIPLIVLIITIFRTQMDRTTEPIDSPSLKVVSIKRVPVDPKVWEIEKSKSRKWRTYTYILLYIYLLVNVSVDPLNASRLFATPIIYIALLCFIAALYLDTFTYRGRIKNPDTARYFLFKDLDIRIVANFHFLFNKSHESLKSLGFKILELDEGEGVLEACYIPFFGSAKLINVKIEHIDNSENTYMINVSVERMDPQDQDKQKLPWGAHLGIAIRRLFKKTEEENKEENRIKVLSKDLYESSKIRNRFVNRLISKPKNVDNKGTNKIDAPSAGES